MCEVLNRFWREKIFNAHAWIGLDCIMFVEMFGEVAKRDEHFQNMKKFEKCFDLHQTIFEQRRTLPNMKISIEQGGQTRRTFAEHES